MRNPHDDDTPRRDWNDPDEKGAFEVLLGESIRPFLAEIYLINARILATYIIAEHDGNVGDMVDSSLEMLRRPELLRYARSAAVDFDWDASFAITIRMEFVHETVRALFDLIVENDTVGVDIIDVTFRGDVVDRDEAYALFARAMTEFRRLDS